MPRLEELPFVEIGRLCLNFPITPFSVNLQPFLVLFRHVDLGPCAGIDATTLSLTIGVGNDGGIFFDRFHGWYKTGPKMLQSVLHAGCYNDNAPHPITSVKLALATKAPKERVDLVNSILRQEGWTQDKIVIQPWSQYPRRP
jgi:hypothetical protein